MNKIFTSILALACLGTVDVDALTLSRNGQPLKDGDVITVGYLVEVPALSLVKWETSILLETNASSIILTGTCNDVAHADLFQDCSFGLCKPGPFNNTYDLIELKDMGYTSPYYLQIHRGMQSLDAATEVGDLTGILTVADANNEDDKVTVTINFLVKPAEEVGALDNVAANGEYVRLESGNTLSYNLNGNTHIEVYSILGTRMIDRHVSGHGSLSISGLGRGVYIYRAGKLSGKVVVK